MTDYARPQSQWQDLPTTASVLLGYSLEYDADTGVLTIRDYIQDARSGIILVTDDGETQTWTVVERVNGEVEAAVVLLPSGTVEIYAP
jgi:hypothetical protein